MAEFVKQKEKKRGSWLGARKSSTTNGSLSPSAEDQDPVDGNEKEVSSGAVIRKNPTFGRSFSKQGKSVSIASMSFSPEPSPKTPKRSASGIKESSESKTTAAEPLKRKSQSQTGSALATRGVTKSSASTASVTGSPVSRLQRERSGSLGSGVAGGPSLYDPRTSYGSAPPSEPKKSSMTGMAAAFDLLISEQELPIEQKYEELQIEHTALQDKFMRMEARALAAEKKLAEMEKKFGVLSPSTSAKRLSSSGSVSSTVVKKNQAQPKQQPPPPPLLTASGKSLQSLSSPSLSPKKSPVSPTSTASTQAKTPTSQDSIDAEVARVRKEIKAQLVIPTNQRSSGSVASDTVLTKSNGRVSDMMEEQAVDKFERSWLTSMNGYNYGDWRLPDLPGRALVCQVQGYHIEAGDSSMDVLPPRSAHELVEPHLKTSYFAKYIANMKHVSLVGMAGIGSFADIPMIISCEQASMGRLTKLRRKPVLGVIRSPSGSEQVCFTGYDTEVARLPYEAKTCLQFLEERYPGCSFVEVRGAESSSALMKSLLQFEAMSIVTTYKIGVLRWCKGQDENEAFANSASPEFTSFLEFLGKRVELLGWDKFRGGLNVRDLNVTGTHSYYTTIEGGETEIMFHVSSELPFSETDTQCLERKRHLGNDVVVVIFWEGDGEFDPSMVKSQFNHVFIVISVDGSSIPELNKIRYRVTVTCKEDVPRWKPYLPYPPVFDRDEDLRMWLLYKCVNAERASMHAPVFRSKLMKTNTTFLKNLVEKYKNAEDSVKVNV